MPSAPNYVPHLCAGGELITTGDCAPYYQERDLRPFLKDVEVPVWLTNGLRYIEEGHTLFEGLWSVLRADRTRFVLGQWGHGGTRTDFTRLCHRWFDQVSARRPAGHRAGHRGACRWPP